MTQMTHCKFTYVFNKYLLNTCSCQTLLRAVGIKQGTKTKHYFHDAHSTECKNRKEVIIN